MQVPVLRSSCCNYPLVESSLIISVLTSFIKRKDLTLDDLLALYPPVTEPDPVNPKKEIINYPNKYVVMIENKNSINSQNDLQNLRLFKFNFLIIK